MGGASTTEVMRSGGWKTARMVAHYAAGAIAEQGAVAKYLQAWPQPDKVDTRLTTVDARTAALAGLEARLTSTIKSSETQFSQGQQDVENRLTAQIDEIDGRIDGGSNSPVQSG